MKTKLTFENGDCYMEIVPENEWEQKMLGAVAAGGDKLAVTVIHQWEGHYSYQKSEKLRLVLTAVKEQPAEMPHEA